MSSWRDRILNEFTPQVVRLTLVADPGGLLLEEGLLEGVRERGFELIPFEDHVAFRYAYESKFRCRWDLGEHTDLVVVLRSPASELSDLPYDLLQAGRKLSFNLGDIFPNLSYPVVTDLDRGDLDALYEAPRRHAPDPLGDNATKEFVLRHVFEIAPELIKQPSDLLRVLLRRHYRSQRVPPLLDDRFIHLMRKNRSFDDWPLETIVPDRDAFFTFLQERWPIFLDREAAKLEPGIREKPYHLAVDGPADLPLDHHDVRIYIDNLFTEGLLHAVPHEHGGSLSARWVGIGVKTDFAADHSRRLRKLIAGLMQSIPANDAKHTDWFHFARGWAEFVLLLNEQPETVTGETKESAKTLQLQVDAAFAAWLSKRYAGLVNLPPAPPVMLHHLPRFLARQVGEGRSTKVALIVVDGLAMDQWLVIREILSARRPGYRFRDQAVFAWIPSLTSVSRQAAFAGKAPIFSPTAYRPRTRNPHCGRNSGPIRG